LRCCERRSSKFRPAIAAIGEEEKLPELKGGLRPRSPTDSGSWEAGVIEVARYGDAETVVTGELLVVLVYCLPLPLLKLVKILP